MTSAAFIGHGSPMNTLERNGNTDAWRTFGQAVGRPRAFLVVSAHWYTNATAVTAMAHPRTIHDFYGFPDELFAFEYPAPGAPDDPFDWNRRFNEAAIAQVTEAPGDVLRLVEHRDFDLAVPTPDHFLPLVYVAALAAAAGATPQVLVDGYAYASISMTCFTVNGDVQPSDEPGGAPPRRSIAPPDQSNI